MKPIYNLASFCLALFLSFSSANGQSAIASSNFSVQGRLTDLDGNAIADGQHTVTANVYQSGSASAMYSETDQVTTLDGVFDIMLGAGNNSSKLNLTANGSYELGLAVDGGTELMPHLTIGSVPVAGAAHMADTAAVALAVGSNIVATLDSSLGSATVTTVNGAHGNVTINGGGNLAVSTNGSNINLSFTGTGTGGLDLPFSQTASSPNGLFDLTNSGTGAAEILASTGNGNALQLTASEGSALMASDNGAAPAIDVINRGGIAINAMGTVNSAITAATNSASSAVLQLKNAGGSSGAELIQAMSETGTVLDLTTKSMTLIATQDSNSALLKLQNTSANASGDLMSAVDVNGSPLFTLAGSGAATLNSSANTALTISGSAGTAISATMSNANGALLNLRNTASGSGAALIAGLNSSGGAAFSVAANGATSIVSSGSTALYDSVTSSGGTAARIAGGLSLSGPVGSGTISAGNLSTTISNAFAKSNSIIFLTVNSAISGLAPIRITGTSAGSFTVGLLSALALTSDLSFNYLIVNQ